MCQLWCLRCVKAYGQSKCEERLLNTIMLTPIWWFLCNLHWMKEVRLNDPKFSGDKKNLTPHLSRFFRVKCCIATVGISFPVKILWRDVERCWHTPVKWCFVLGTRQGSWSWMMGSTKSKTPTPALSHHPLWWTDMTSSYYADIRWQWLSYNDRFRWWFNMKFSKI